MATPFGKRNVYWAFLLPRLTPAADGLVSAHPLHASIHAPPRVIEKLRGYEMTGLTRLFRINRNT